MSNDGSQRQKKVNIRQVAKAAGVSVATVSGILNSSGRHSPATAARVRAVMQEMGYVPRRNRLRKKAPRGKSAIKRVGLLFPDTDAKGIRTPLGTKLAEGLQKVLAEQNTQVHILTLQKDGSLPAEITSGKLNGLVVRAGSSVAGGENHLSQALADIDLPIVWTFGLTSAPTADAVMVDNRGCGVWGADRVNLDHTDSAFIVLPSGSRNIDLEYRAIAFEIHLQQRGFAASRIHRKTTHTLAKALSGVPASSTVALFVPGHDAELHKAREQLAGRKKSGKRKDQFIGVMTDDLTIKPHTREDLHILHIDPLSIGMAAGQQLLWRLQHPWAEPARLLVPARELSKGPVRR